MTPDQRRQFLPWAITGLALLGVIGVVYAIVARRDPAPVAAPPTAATPAAPIAPPADRVTGDRLAAATLAVFGKAGVHTRTDESATYKETAARVIETAFGPVLLTDSTQTEDCHACAGSLGVYYLKEAGGKFTVAARYPNAMQGWGWGQAPQDWQVSDKFTTNPALYAEGGYMGQGYGTSSAQIVELTPAGPKASSIDLGSDSTGALGDTGKVIEGKIANIVRDGSFDVVFTGDCKGTQRYARENGEFKPAGTSACASEN